MEAFGQLVSLVLLIVGGVFWLVASLGVMTFAEHRGLSSGTYFAAAFFLSPPVAFLAAATARPSFNAKSVKRCPECAETIWREARKCRYCGSPVQVESAG